MTPECVYYKDPYKTSHEGSPYEVLPTPESWDNYVNMEIMLPRGYEIAMGGVTKRDRDLDGNPFGTANENHILDTSQYIFEFADGDEAELSANVIASNMYAQCDPDGDQYTLLGSIIDFRRSKTDFCQFIPEDDTKGENALSTFYRRLATFLPVEIRINILD